MRRILQLGLTAFNNENIHLSESSVGSDISSKQHSSQSPPGSSTSKCRKTTITIPGTQIQPGSKAKATPSSPLTPLNSVDDYLEEAAEASRWTTINTDVFKNDGDEDVEEPSEMNVIMTKKTMVKAKCKRKDNGGISQGTHSNPTSSTEDEDEEQDSNVEFE
jgi:hypothetical protein